MEFCIIVNALQCRLRTFKKCLPQLNISDRRLRVWSLNSAFSEECFYHGWAWGINCSMLYQTWLLPFFFHSSFILRTHLDFFVSDFSLASFHTFPTLSRSAVLLKSNARHNWPAPAWSAHSSLVYFRKGQRDIFIHEQVLNWIWVKPAPVPSVPYPPPHPDLQQAGSDLPALYLTITKTPKEQLNSHKPSKRSCSQWSHC